MLNIFKSPPKPIQATSTTTVTFGKGIRDSDVIEENLLTKQFNGLNIAVYGTYEEPLFKAREIGDLLGIKNIREVIKNYNDKQKGVGLTDTLGGQQEVTFLTEQGLYKLLMRSRKKVAEQFQDWVCEVIKEIRLR